MSEITNAIKHLCEERGISYDSVLKAVELALAAAYRKDYGVKISPELRSRAGQNIKVKFDPETSNIEIYDVKTVVEDMPNNIEDKESQQKDKNLDFKDEKINDKKLVVDSAEENNKERKFNPKTEIQLSDALDIKSDAKVGEEIWARLPQPEGFGRMAAQTAKQVIIQKLKEIEKNTLFEEFKTKEHEVVSGIVQRTEGRIVLVDLGKVVGIMLPEYQIFNEKYNPGTRLKFFIEEVKMGAKGPEVILSRTNEEIVRKVFYLEIPEISNGLIDIKRVAREPSFRSKVAVQAVSENIDPIGSCIGQRGSRIQTIISELGGEKIDIIEYSDDPAEFITNALLPAKILDIKFKETENEKSALVTVSPDQFSLAIGKNGQNVRLAAKLTGWRIDIKESSSDKVSKDKASSVPDDAKKLEDEKSLDKSKDIVDKENLKDKEESGKNKKDLDREKDN